MIYLDNHDPMSLPATGQKRVVRGLTKNEEDDEHHKNGRLHWPLRCTRHALCRNKVKRRKEFDGRNYELFYMTATLPSSLCHVSG